MVPSGWSLGASVWKILGIKLGISLALVQCKAQEFPECLEPSDFQVWDFEKWAFRYWSSNAGVELEPFESNSE